MDAVTTPGQKRITPVTAIIKSVKAVPTKDDK
jgi:hypothetical protein